MSDQLNVVFVAPYLMPNTVRYARALAAVDGVALCLLTCDRPERLQEVAPELGGVAVGPVSADLDADALVEAIEALMGDGAIPDRLLGMLEQLQLPLAQARSRLGIPGMDAETARAFRDKDCMKEVLAAAGLPVARFRRVESIAAGMEFGEAVGMPLVLKPVAGVGARATYRIDDLQQLRAALQQLQPSAQNPVQAEEFVTGTERTFEAVMIDGECVWWSGTRYHPTPLQVLQNGWMQYTVTLPAEETAPWTSFVGTGTAALRALGMETGLAHMEWFETADGRHVIGEVGARPPGVNIMPLMSHAFDADMVAAWCGLMTRGRWDIGARVRAAGSAFFRGQGRGSRVVNVRGLHAAHEAVGALVVERRLPRVGQPVSTSYEGEGWAIVAAPTTDEVVSALGVLVRTVRVELG